MKTQTYTWRPVIRTKQQLPLLIWISFFCSILQLSNHILQRITLFLKNDKRWLKLLLRRKMTKTNDTSFSPFFFIRFLQHICSVQWVSFSVFRIEWSSFCLFFQLSRWFYYLRLRFLRFFHLPDVFGRVLPPSSECHSTRQHHVTLLWRRRKKTPQHVG